MGRFRDVELADLELTGDRLLLRRWRPEDATRVYEVMQDASMYEFMALPRPYTVAAAREFVTGAGHEGRGEGTGMGAAVVDRVTGRVVGSAALRLTGQADVGYWIAPDARGHGYAREVCRLLASFGFGLGLPRVQLVCDVRNVASARTALAAGFGFEGVARDAGRTTSPIPKPADLAWFARLPESPDAPVAYAFATLPPGGLTDGVIGLRALAASDAAAFAETDDDLTLRVGFGGPTSTARDYERAAARAALDWLVGTRAMFAITDVETGSFAGSVTLRPAGPPQVGGIGYVVHPAFRGRGYTTLALRLLLPWAFETAGFARLELGAKITNVASRRAAERAGFEADGIRRCRLRNVDGTFADEARYALVKPDYA
ncbi:MAG: GNAT family N-acetyltransferase [Jatrophihabitans sp.]